MFSIYWRGQVIGHSELEFGDAPMGVAFGRFFPADGFGAFCETAPLSVRSSEDLRFWEDLSMTTSEGASLECMIVSLSRHEYDGQVDLQIEAVVIDAATYQCHFPRHVRDYERGFRPSGGPPRP